MTTPKTTKLKSKSNSWPLANLRQISWLKFLPNLTMKQLLISILAVAVIAYGSFITYRALYSGYCNDWIVASSQRISVGSMSFTRPEGWQMHDCFDHPEEEYKAVTLLDYQIPDLARLAWISGVSDGWGMFAPTNSGRIEISISSIAERQSLAEIEKRWLSFIEGGSPLRIGTRRVKVANYDALEIKYYSEPDTNNRPQRSSGRYGYAKDLFIETSNARYELRLQNTWHKPDSRDAWVEKYEPVFTRLVESIEFK